MWYFQYKKPDNWVIATNKETTVKDFEQSCKNQFKIKWIGKGINERAINLDSNQIIIDINKKFFRPTEVDFLKGDLKQEIIEMETIF